jgi:hypothetical protein
MVMDRFVASETTSHLNHIKALLYADRFAEEESSVESWIKCMSIQDSKRSE